MLRKRLAALVLTGCMLSSVGCSTSGGGLFSGGSGGGGSGAHCCGGGLFSRMWGSGSSASAPVMPVSSGAYAGGYSGGSGGIDCPCSHQGGNAGMFHPAVMSQGGMPSGSVVGDMQGQSYPIQQFQQFQGQPVPVTTPGVPPGVPGQNQPPRIQTLPMTPSGVAPSGGMAPSAPWGPQQQ